MSEAARYGWLSAAAAWRLPLPSLEQVLAAVFVLAVLMPYLSPRPITGMDVQPVAMALAPVLIASRWLAGELRLSRGEWWLVGLGLGSLLYCLPFRFSGLAEYVRVCAPLAIGAAIVLGLNRALRLISPAVVLIAAAAYLAGVLVQLALPGVYSGVVAPFLSEVRYDPTAMRGPNGIAVEPSMVGNVCALFIALPALYRESWWKTRPALGLALRSMAAVTAVLTASVTGILSCMVVAAALYLRGFDARVLWRVLGIGGAVLLAGWVAIRLEPGGRIGDLLAGASENPLWILTELSIVLRYAGGLVSLSNLGASPFGDGIGQLAPAIVDRGVAFWANLLNWDAYYVSAVAGYIEATASGLSSLVIRAGVFGLAAIAFLFMLVSRGRHGLVRGLLVATMLVNVSLATPFVWLVFSLGLLAQAEGSETAVAPSVRGPGAGQGSGP
jgi:hypothetical protein